MVETRGANATYSEIPIMLGLLSMMRKEKLLEYGLNFNLPYVKKKDTLQVNNF